MEGILHALSDPVRAAIYTQLANSHCPAGCSDFLRIDDRSIPKSTLSVHFRALRDAGLIRSERHGVEVRNTSRHEEIEQRFPGLLKAILQAHEIQSAGRSVKKARAPARSKRS